MVRCAQRTFWPYFQPGDCIACSLTPIRRVDQARGTRKCSWIRCALYILSQASAVSVRTTWVHFHCYTCCMATAKETTEKGDYRERRLLQVQGMKPLCAAPCFEIYHKKRDFFTHLQQFCVESFWKMEESLQKGCKHCQFLAFASKKAEKEGAMTHFCGKYLQCIIFPV